MSPFFMTKSTFNQETTLAQEVSSQFTFAKRYLDPVHERMNNQEELYRSYINPSNYPNNARVFDPRTFRVIETITPRMVANEPTGNFYPAEQGDIVTSQILSALIKYDWRKAEMFPKLVNFVKSMLIFGTAFGRTYWDYRTCDKQRMIPKMINGKNVWTPKNKEMISVTEFDSPNFEVLNIYDCFPDPNATTMANMRWFIYRMFKTIDELEKENNARGAEHWKNLDKLKTYIADKKSRKNSGTQPNDLQYREHRRVMLSTQELIGQDETSPEFPVFVRFTKERWVYCVPEFDLVIRDVENPYFHGEIPIVHGVDYPYPGELYGMGEIEPIDRIQRAINAVLNQRLDNVQLTLNTMWKAKKGGQVDLHTLISKPGNIITLTDMDAVEPISVPDVTGGTFVQTMNYLTSALQNGSGITDYTIGINSGANTANETATGTRLIQQEANSQFKLKIQLFNHMVMERIVNQWKDLRIQYTTEEQELRILGKEQVRYLLEHTNLATTSLETGEEILPGDFETPTKLNISSDQEFAFLKLYPDDIQPAIVGDYDFIASVTPDMLNDPMAQQENFFIAIDKYRDPQWLQGLAQQGKTLNFEQITKKGIEKLGLGMGDKDILIDLPQQDQEQAQGEQPLTQEQIDMMKMPMEDPLQIPEGGQDVAIPNTTGQPAGIA